jgi:hypothetical protein
MLIRPYQPSDWSEWLRMSRQLFPGFMEADEAEMRSTLARADAAVFVLDRTTGGKLAGYVEVGARSSSAIERMSGAGTSRSIAS